MNQGLCFLFRVNVFKTRCFIFGGKRIQIEAKMLSNWWKASQKPECGSQLQHNVGCYELCNTITLSVVINRHNWIVSSVKVHSRIQEV